MFLGIILFAVSNTFANKGYEKELKIKNVKPVMICKTSSAIDEDGNIVASASCCRTYSAAPSQATLNQANIELMNCAEAKLQDVLTGQD
ncbi:MAG: hypothetical protein LDL23_00780 [Flavobacterium sp.]|uniref:hypothetical protein n=1 Tax=Flavobacterium sp. TaxID=239 RepID=UPI0025C725AD|nr:hypothetical protein [Flavobacterium sp.]MCA1965160.1 hypothetical protein [Flavobacterium sp.]